MTEGCVHPRATGYIIFTNNGEHMSTFVPTWEVWNGQTRLGSVQAFNIADAIHYMEQRLGILLPEAVAIPLDLE